MDLNIVEKRVVFTKKCKELNFVYVRPNIFPRYIHFSFLFSILQLRLSTNCFGGLSWKKDILSEDGKGVTISINHYHIIIFVVNFSTHIRFISSMSSAGSLTAKHKPKRGGEIAGSPRMRFLSWVEPYGKANERAWFAVRTVFAFYSEFSRCLLYFQTQV